MGRRKRRRDERREERLGRVRWPLSRTLLLLPLAKKPFIKKTRVQAQFRDRTFLIGPFFLLAAGLGGWWWFLAPSQPSFFSFSNRPTHTPPPHTLHGDCGATTAINVPNGVSPPHPYIFILPSPFFICLVLFSLVRKNPKKTKWPIFIILVFTMGNIENRDLYHWLNIGDVFTIWPTRPTTKNGTRKMAARSHTHVRVCVPSHATVREDNFFPLACTHLATCLYGVRKKNR